MKPRLANSILCLVMFLTAIIFYFQTAPIKYPSNVFPYLLIAAIFVFTVIILIRNVFCAQDEPAAKEKRNLKKVLLLAVASVLYVLLVNTVGFYTVSTVFLIIMSNLLHSTQFAVKRLLGSIILTAGVMTVVFVLFNLFLKVPIPSGLLI